MSGVIFLIQGEKLVELEEAKYDSEKMLQILLADYPKILAGDQIDSENPRKWLLVDREIGVPNEENASPVWSLDHLFIDQDSIPTFVETKQSSNREIRRQIVGQMLDYAANAVKYWQIKDIQNVYERQCAKNHKEPVTNLGDALGIDIDYDVFWQNVNSNLEDRNIRMLFVSDEIPLELQSITEFLNENTKDEIQILCIEVKQYIGEKVKLLVPRVIGLTAKAVIDKTPTPRYWNKESFLSELETRQGISDKQIMEKIFGWLEQKKIDYKFGNGRKIGTCNKIFLNGEYVSSPFNFQTDGLIYVQFDRLKITPHYSDIHKRQELLENLNQISGITIKEEYIDAWQAFLISSLKEEKNLETFLHIFAEVIEHLKITEE
jgi:hypothetical protein